MSERSVHCCFMAKYLVFFFCKSQVSTAKVDALKKQKYFLLIFFRIFVCFLRFVIKLNNFILSIIFFFKLIDGKCFHYIFQACKKQRCLIMKRILSKSFKILRERIKYHLFSLGKKTVTIYNWNRRGEELRPSKMASHFSFDSKSSWNFFFFSKTKVYFANVIIIDRQHDLSLIFSLKIKLPLINIWR